MTQQTVMISQEAFNSDDPCELVEANVYVVNALYKNFLTEDEICKEALLSYYLDYYLVQVQSGGFAHFLANSDLNEYILASVAEALKRVGAQKNLALFEQGIKILNTHYPESQRDFLDDYYGAYEQQAMTASKYFVSINNAFSQLENEEDLLQLNAQWLRQLPNLLVLPAEKLEEQIRLQAKKITNLEERQAAAIAQEAFYIKAIKKLCSVAGHILHEITIGYFIEYAGEEKMAWFFLTNKGCFYMIEHNNKAIMYEDEINEYICEIDKSLV